jgi:TIR domain
MAGPKSDAEACAEAGPQHGESDVFLSHAGEDKTWVLTLVRRLEALNLRVFVDVLEIDPGDNWVIRLNDALERSRYLVLVLSNQTAGRPWVIQEWTSWMAGHSPLGRLLPVTIDAVELPFILKATQAIDATHRDAQQVADALFKVVGDPATLPSADARRLVLGRDLVFTLCRDDEQLTVVTPSGESRQAPLPWQKDNRFGIAHLGFFKLHREPATGAAARTELFRHARTLGSFLFEALFDEADAARLDKLIGPDRPRPVIQVRSDDPLLLSLP